MPVLCLFIVVTYVRVLNRHNHRPLGITEIQISGGYPDRLHNTAFILLDLYPTFLPEAQSSAYRISSFNISPPTTTLGGTFTWLIISQIQKAIQFIMTLSTMQIKTEASTIKQLKEGTKILSLRQIHIFPNSESEKNTLRLFKQFLDVFKWFI